MADLLVALLPTISPPFPDLIVWPGWVSEHSFHHLMIQ